MQRIIWIGGVACIAHVACIEDRSPNAEVDDAVADAMAEPEPAPDPDPPDPDPREPQPVDPEPAAPEPAPGEPEPELPPWICPPEGVFVFNVGACVAEGDDLPSTGRFEARIVAVGAGRPAEGPCSPAGAQPTLGRIGSDGARWFNAVTPDGKIWQIVLDLPVDMRFELGEELVIDAEVVDGLFDGVSGRLAISTAAGLQAFVQAGDRGEPSLEDPELRLRRGLQTCFVGDPEGDFCTYTGYELNAYRSDTVNSLVYGEIVVVGPFDVINGGILSIGDLGACNAAPEDFKVAAWRRR